MAIAPPPLNQTQGKPRIKSRALQQQACFRNNGFTAQQWRLETTKLFSSPMMMGVAATQESNPRACIKWRCHDQVAAMSDQ